MRRVLTSAGLAAVVLGAALSSRAADGEPLSGEDQRAIQANLQSYREAWLRGDAKAVMATLGPNPVLLPSGQPPIVGEEAIRAFWWPPDSPPGRVVAMELQVEAMSGQAGIAFAWGRGSLTFSYEEDGQEKLFTAASTFLNVLRKGPDGRWKTSCRMWSDLSRQ